MESHETMVARRMLLAGAAGLFALAHAPWALAKLPKSGVKGLIAGHDPARCFLLGDTKIDAAAGRSAGIPTFGAGFGYLNQAEHALFDRVFPTPDAILIEAAGPAGVQKD